MVAYPYGESTGIISPYTVVGFTIHRRPWKTSRTALRKVMASLNSNTRHLHTLHRRLMNHCALGVKYLGARICEDRARGDSVTYMFHNQSEMCLKQS
jgi:hypothetical protein